MKAKNLEALETDRNIQMDSEASSKNGISPLDTVMKAKCII